ncbi:oxidoreductase [Archaeoglobales archaeon]|nr:MAG: oxidoreductase [Archaeoglobales archaeon]
MILITGGNGYIGTEIAKILLKKREDFRIMDNLSGSNPLNLLYLNRIDFFWGDVRNDEDLRLAFKDVEIVIHLAAKLPTTPGLLDKVEEVAKIEEINYSGTLNVLEEARRKDTTLIFASTCNVYGIGENISEESKPNPLNPYAESKLEAEKACIDYVEKYGMDIKILRLASVYGFSPGVRFNLVVNYFVLRGLLGYKLAVFGNGDNWRPFIHVHDAATAFLHLIDNGKRGEIYNVAESNLRIIDVAKTVKKNVNPQIDIELVREIKPEFSYSVDSSKFLKTGYKFRHNFESGILHLVEKLKSLKSQKI